MRKVFFASLIFFSVPFLLSAPVSAQQITRCATTEYLQSREEKFPGTIRRLNELQQTAKQWIADHPEALRSTYIIPVVVHVIWHADQENISLSKIMSQINVLNEDFNRQNVDTFKTPSVWKSVAGSMSVLFCLAAQAPDGSDTNGVTRTYTDVASFEVDDKMKHNNTGGADGWPSDDYLNIWVCNLVNNSNGGDVLGFTSVDPGHADDGVVVRYDVLGRGESLKSPYDEGRTCTHEAGHWLSLVHTFDGGCYSSDGCDDTPPESEPVFGCPSYPHKDECSINYPGVMFMNYMDYTDDDCMNLFSLCQCGDMIGMLNTSRQSLMSSPAGCLPVTFNVDAGINKIAIPDDTLPAQGFQPQVQLTNHGLNEITYVQINYQVDGQPVAVYSYQGSLASQLSTLIPLPYYFTGEGGHIMYAWTSNPNHSDDQLRSNDTASEEFFVKSSAAKNSTIISVQQESPTDQPVVKVQNPSAAILHLQVVNVLGQIVQEGNWSVIDNPTFIVDLSNVPNGIYFLYGKIGYDYMKMKVMVVRK